MKKYSVLLVTLNAFVKLIVFQYIHACNAINNGKLVGKDEMSYVVAVLIKNHMCSGGILDEKYIITAAHCTIDAKTNEVFDGEFKVVAGTKDLKDETSAIEIVVEKIYLPLMGNGEHWKIDDEGDIAILELTSPLDLENNSNLAKLNLPEANYLDNTLFYENCQVGGFGWNEVIVKTEYSKGNISQTVTGTTSKQLRKIDVLVTYMQSCKSLFKYNVTSENYLCARHGSISANVARGTCRGDSGAPLTIKNNVIIGILSASNPQCNEFSAGSVYTRVTAYRTFIEDVLKNNYGNLYVKTTRQTFGCFGLPLFDKWCLEIIRSLTNL